MMNILLNGCNGRMGRVITNLAKDDGDIKIAAGVDTMPGKQKNDYPTYGTLDDVKESIDVIVDFSNIKGLPLLLKYGVSKSIPIVICTTGQSAKDREMIESASTEIPVLTSANMSIGVNLILGLVKEAAKALEGSFDIEIIEKHHNQKVDSPSGTALAIADSINSVLSSPKKYVYGRHCKNDKRTDNEIGIHAIRGGSIVGDHSVIFAGQGEVIEISHSAISRDVFGIGALAAARFICGKKPGLYSMDNVIKQTSK
ncbi:MAG TPA: 4-hydroxy-tetrahydrodipicolinate reductase [Clostridiaceae bacterium]|nr:4-hydroxy-tetrahydrodipicolinate reductase [Clostridiaceae bacterium]